MSNPVLVEVLRGPLVESRHRGAVCVMDAGGATVFSLGEVATPVYPRSAVKPIQALPLVESGAAIAMVSAMKNWRWRAPAMAASRRMSRSRSACWRAPGST